jgi:hypothetical protein
MKIIITCLTLVTLLSCSKPINEQSKYINLLKVNILKKYPKTILISHDDYHAKHIGKTSDGRQFFLTQAFESKTGNSPIYEYIVLYYFNLEGKLLDCKILDLGRREDLEDSLFRSKYDQLLKSIPEPTFCDINISPFKIEHKKTYFGLFPYDWETGEEEDKSLQVQPGDFMSFYPPWNGDYDT